MEAEKAISAMVMAAGLEQVAKGDVVSAYGAQAAMTLIKKATEDVMALVDGDMPFSSVLKIVSERVEDRIKRFEEAL